MPTHYRSFGVAEYFREKNGIIEDGTAIGMGLATAVKRLKDSEAKSKVIILLTDGVNTGGSIPPHKQQREIARTFGIRVYTIGVGTIGMAPYPGKDVGQTVYQDMEVKIDEPMMKGIAEMTGGQYFRQLIMISWRIFIRKLMH